MKQPKVLLIISCAKKKAKRLHHQKMRASEAYIGPMFQVIHKAQHENRWSSNISLGIISAKYGFLRSDDLIEYYNLKMTNQLAVKYNHQVIQAINEWHKEVKFDLIYVLMGKTYLQAVEGLESHVDAQLVVENMGGLGIGQQKLKRLIEKFSEKPQSLTDYLK